MFSERIRAAREAKKLSQEKLGQLIGVSGVAISHYETGKREPDQETLSRIASAVGVSLASLVEGGTDPGEIRGYVVKGLGWATRTIAAQWPHLTTKAEDMRGMMPRTINALMDAAFEFWGPDHVVVVHQDPNPLAIGEFHLFRVMVRLIGSDLPPRVGYVYRSLSSRNLLNRCLLELITFELVDLRIGSVVGVTFVAPRSEVPVISVGRR